MSQLIRLRKYAISFAVFAVIGFGSALTSYADPVVLVLQGPAFSSNTPTGSITVTITQSGANTVQFNIANNTNGDIDEIYFNNTLATVAAWGTAGACADCSAITFGMNAFQADGDGRYDLLVQFPTSGGAHGATRFEPGSTVVFTVSATGITPETFLALSSPAGGSGPFFTAAHVISIDSAGGGSGWIPGSEVPEPATLLLLGSGLFGVAAGVRKNFRKAPSKP